ncbi:MAG: hypothetical protein ABIH23_13615 [bacterium]
MKRSVILLVPFFAALLCAGEAPAGDEWDPDDDSYRGSTDLGKPTSIGQTDGPHSLSNNDRSDWFQFTLIGDQQYTFWSTGDCDTFGTLYGDDGWIQRDCDDDSGIGNNFRIVYTPVKKGTCFLRVSLKDPADSGSYVLHWTGPEPPPADGWDPDDDVLEGATVLSPVIEGPRIEHDVYLHGPHTLSPLDLYDWFQFDLREGWHEFWSSGESDTDATLYQLLANGSLEEIVWDHSRGIGKDFANFYRVKVSGTYLLRVQTEDVGENGSYMLHACETGSDAWDPADDLYSRATPLGVPPSSVKEHKGHTMLDGESGLDESDWFQFFLSEGVSHEFWSVGNAIVRGRLYRFDGILTRIKSDSLSGPDRNFLIEYTPESDGYYLLEVRTTYVPSSYDLCYCRTVHGDGWDPADDWRRGATDLEEPLWSEHTNGPHTLSLLDPEDRFRFTLSKGVLYEFWSTGETNTVGQLLDEAGSTLAMNYQSGEDKNFLIRYMPKVAGLYYLEVSRADEGSGGLHSYVLHYRKAPLETQVGDWRLR